MRSRTPLTNPQLADLARDFPNLRADYLRYMSTVGYGEAESGCVIYPGPIDPCDIYGASFNGPNVVLLGDDFQGYCFGYDLDAQCYGEVSDTGVWEPWPLSDGLDAYVR